MIVIWIMVLKLSKCLIIFFLGFYLLFLKEKESKILISIKLKYKVFFGILSGFISAPMGIGGAVMNVPVFKFFGYSINRQSFFQ